MSKTIKNSEYLESVLASHSHPSKLVLLPHEMYAVQMALRNKADDFKEIIEAKVAVSGGDDWHDGAFRTTDTLAQILSQSANKIQPYQGASTVEYPSATETRVSLGSRILLTQAGVILPVDIVGFRAGYPDNIVDEQTDEEVMATSPESPLGAAILGHIAGEQIHYQAGQHTLEATITSVNQTAVRELFMQAAEVSLELFEELTEE